MKIRKLIDSFNYAVTGVIYTFRTQRNMKIHYLVAVMVLLLSILLGLSKLEIIAVFFAISLVIITEMINTSIEATIDIYVKEFHPLAKIAKNVAAGSVLIAAINSLVVAYFVFYDRLNMLGNLLIRGVYNFPPYVTLVTLIIVVIITVAIKSVSAERKILRGGMPSGHTAIAFSIATAITLIVKNAFIAFLSFFLALLVAHSRIEGRIHSFLETIIGAIIGLLVTIFIFQVISRM